MDTTETTYRRNGELRETMMNWYQTDFKDHTLLTSHFPRRFNGQRFDEYDAIKYHRNFLKTLNRKIYGKDGRFYRGKPPRRQFPVMPIFELHPWNGRHSHILMDRPSEFSRPEFTMLLKKTWIQTRLTSDYESPRETLMKDPHVTYDNITIDQKTGYVTKFDQKPFHEYDLYFDFTNLYIPD